MNEKSLLPRASKKSINLPTRQTIATLSSQYTLTRGTGEATSQTTGQRAERGELGREGAGQALFGARQEGRAGVYDRANAARGRLDLLGYELVDELAGRRLGVVDLVGGVLELVALVEDRQGLRLGVEEGVQLLQRLGRGLYD